MGWNIPGPHRRHCFKWLSSKKYKIVGVLEFIQHRDFTFIRPRCPLLQLWLYHHVEQASKVWVPDPSKALLLHHWLSPAACRDLSACVYLLDLRPVMQVDRPQTNPGVCPRQMVEHLHPIDAVVSSRVLRWSVWNGSGIALAWHYRHFVLHIHSVWTCGSSSDYCLPCLLCSTWLL
jgi:hypothetical protein